VNIVVREATPDDAAGVAGILNPIIESRRYTVLDRPFSVDEERRFIERFPARGVFHVALLDGRLAGFQNVEPFASYTSSFDHVGLIGTYVDLSLRRRGIGARLFAATFEAATRKGFEKLFAYVRADNPDALDAYRRQGFTVIGTAHKQARLDGRYIDEILIERWLGEGKD